MADFPGFPAASAMRWVPVPGVVLGQLLAEIDDPDELRLLLRVFALLHDLRSFPRAIAVADLRRDPVLVKALRLDADREALDRALAACQRRGTLVLSGAGAGRRVLLNTPADRRIARRLEGAAPAGPPAIAEASDREPVPPATRSNIFVLYEDNIGPLSPLLADALADAERTYPASWIEAAFREAITRNRRSWRYVQRILERWQYEGKAHGERGRDPEADRSLDRYTQGRYGHVVRY